MYYEEVDLAYRMETAGWETHFAPVADVTHLGGATTVNAWSAMRVRYFRSLAQFGATHLSRAASMRLAVTLHVLAVVKLALESTRRRLVRDPERRRDLDTRVELWRDLARVQFTREVQERRARGAALKPEARREALREGRRRLLFMLAFPPRTDATHGGARAMANIMTALSGRHDVAAIYLRGEGEPPMDPVLRERCAVAVEVPRDAPPGLWSRVAYQARVLIARARGIPGWPAYWGAGQFAGRAHRLVRQWQPDVVHFEFLAMGQFAEALADRSALRVLTPHEPYSAAAEERAQLYRGLPRLRAKVESALWRRYERRVMRAMDAVVAFTERDVRALRAVAGNAVVFRIPLGTVLPERAMDPLAVDRREVLFVGNFTHPPNADAALRLVRTIGPLLWARAPEARLVTVGPVPPDALRAAACERVIVTGEVDDVAPYLERAAVVAVPLRTGGGMRVKVLEALAAGKAVVASPRSLEGLDVRDGREVIVADSDADFADAIASLLQQPERRASLGAHARAWACDTFSDERWADAYDELYSRMDRSADRRITPCIDACIDIRAGRPPFADADDRAGAADWRFLLPRPASGRYDRLAVPGAPDQLLDTLSAMGLAAEVTGVLPSDHSASAVVVLPGTLLPARALRGALADGGALYIETDRRAVGCFWRTPGSWKRDLDALGVRVTGVYAVGRRGLAPRRYVALDEAAPGLWFLRSAYRPVTATQSGAGLVASALLMMRLHRVVLQRIIPAYAITAVVGHEPTAPMVLLRDTMQNITVHPEGEHVVLFGDGGDRVVALPFAASAPEPAMVIKVPRSPAFGARTENEQARMRQLRGSLPPDLARAIPEPLGLFGSHDSLAAAEAAAPPGRTLLASSGRWGASAKRRIADLELATEWLADFHAATAAGWHDWGPCQTEKLVNAAFASYFAAYGELPLEQALRDTAMTYARTIAGVSIPSICQHRDYAVWNLVRAATHGRDELSVLDWEGARMGPPLCDMLHLVTSWDMAIRRPGDMRDEMTNFGALFLEPPDGDVYRAAARRAIRRYLQRVAIDDRLVPVLLLHHTLELAIRRAEQITDRAADAGANARLNAVDGARAGNRYVAMVALLAGRVDALFNPGP
jgi:glycosyltransferase involved in cell wall biosynthesis/aminoglycoside phosphotransferase (APT) family kinase protein